MLSGEYTLMHLAGGIIKIKFGSGFIEARVLLYTVFIYVFYIYYFIQNKTSPKLTRIYAVPKGHGFQQCHCIFALADILKVPLSSQE